MDLQHLKYFYWVAQKGSFSAAARELRINQSSLSKAVALLEAREGVQLLERSKKGVALTSIGEAVFFRCQMIFKEVESIQESMSRSLQLIGGPLNVGMSDHIANYLIADSFAKFVQKYPQVLPSAYVGAPPDILSKIHSKHIEFGLFFTKVQQSGIEYRRLGRFEIVLVEKPKKLVAGIVGSIQNDYERHPSHRIFEARGGKPQLSIESNSQEFQKKACLAGFGSALLAQFMVKDEIKDGRLRKLPLESPIWMDLLLAKRKSHIFSRTAELFIEEFQDAIQK